MTRTVADQMVDTLSTADVRRVYGIVGDSLNGFTDAVRRHGGIEWLHTRHEEVAAFAAGADAAITGEVAVCAGSCGPGNLHLINGLFDCHRSRVPVVAIAAHIPSAEIGSGYFQETHPEQLFRECSNYCELVATPEQMPRAFDTALRRASAERCVCVIVIPGDVALQPATSAPAPSRRALCLAEPEIVPQPDVLDAMADILNSGERITLLCGGGCAGALDALLPLADTLASPIVHALRGKEYVEANNPYDVGMTGLIGFASGYHAMEQCDVLLMLGTDFPYRQFYPAGARIIQVDIRAEAIGRRAPVELGVLGQVRATLSALLPRLRRKDNREHLEKALGNYRAARASLDELAIGRPGGRLHPQHVVRVASEQATKDAIFTADVGLPTVWAARYLRIGNGRRLLGSFWHGSMANALAQAIGAQAAAPDRQVVALCGDGGFTMLMGDLLSLKQLNLPVKVIIFNNGSLGFIELEQKSSGFLDTGTRLDNPDFAAMAESVGIRGFRLDDPAEVEDVLGKALAYPGPVVVDAAVTRMELAMPPKVTSAMAKGFTLYMLKAVLNGRADEVIDLAANHLRR
ncbi:ubiquinone-dependent pyruvate dehydrogenase [Paraburkholderia graminis]|uniref:ubiquinone-dependent pyruvate dehydrogenase n=1 Tax=Paraburkholderia graminis TaxID=60548 RepID=UPI00278F8F63|nr:ubiquinone-dependent pyruvate dehydrogenase [Paraburkholderia graminis]MDQ0625977.1 pyruvate dehydrogenase (quinone) [Paraburkholderia graminis]